jgi:hypothetical protein
MNALLDRIHQHAGADLRRRIEVPEWGEPAVIDAEGNEVSPAKPLVILYDMVTLDDLATIHDLDGSTWHKQAPRIVAMKSLDEAGEPLFRMIDAVALRQRAAPDVVNRIALAMLGRTTVEEAAKN